MPIAQVGITKGPEHRPKGETVQQDRILAITRAMRIDHRDGRHDEYPDARCPECAEWTS